MAYNQQSCGQTPPLPLKLLQYSKKHGKKGRLEQQHIHMGSLSLCSGHKGIHYTTLPYNGLSISPSLCLLFVLPAVLYGQVSAYSTQC